MPNKRNLDDGEQQIAVVPEEDQVKQTTARVDFVPAAEVKETSAKVVLKLVDTHRKGGAYIDGEDFVFDPNFDNGEGRPKGKQRAIRLLRGVNTIFVDEQKELKDDFINRNKRSLEFHKLGRQCDLQPYDKTAIQFAELCNSNEGNPYRFGVKPIYFNIWNPFAQEEEAQRETDQMLEAMQIAATMPLEKMKRHCVHLKIPVTDEVGEKLQEGRLRKNFLAYANKNAKKFIDSTKDVSVDIAFGVKLLISRGDIDTETRHGQAYYHEGGFIADIPTGQDAEEFLIKFAMSKSEDGKDFADRVKLLAKL